VDRGAEQLAEECLSRVVLRTDMGEVFSLDFYDEAEGIVYRGFYLPPYSLQNPATTSLPDPLLPPEVEFTVPADVVALVRRSVREVGEHEDRRLFGLADPAVSDYRFWVDVSQDSIGEAHGALVWAGTVVGHGGRFSFLLERHGSPEMAVLLVLLFILIFCDRRASEASAECYRRAVEACGKRRIKRCSSGRTLTAISPKEMSFSYHCEWECR
jgi:hypothetical protein